MFSECRTLGAPTAKSKLQIEHPVTPPPSHFPITRPVRALTHKFLNVSRDYFFSKELITAVALVCSRGVNSTFFFAYYSLVGLPNRFCDVTIYSLMNV